MFAIGGSVSCSIALLLGASGCAQELAPAAPVEPRTIVTFGSTGSGPGQFANPRAIAASPDGKLFVIDKSGRVQRFSSDGRYETHWSLPECDKGYPSGIDVAPDGRVFVADTHYGRILIYDGDGYELSRFGVRGMNPGELLLVTDVAVARDGSIYVSEFGGNDRISKFDSDGNYLLSFGGMRAGSGALRRPSGLACDSERNVWVADSGNHRVCCFRSDGSFVGSFGALGRELGNLRYPRDVSLLDDGLLAVVDSGNDRVQCFTRDGGYVSVWGRPGRRSGELHKPLNVACDAGRVFIADSGNNRIALFAVALVNGPALGSALSWSENGALVDARVRP